MYTTCPKCDYKRKASDQASKDECPNCGLVFSKWLRSLVEEEELPSVHPSDFWAKDLQKTFIRFFLPDRSSIRKGEFIAYLMFWLVFAWWGIGFVLMDFQSNEIGRSWLHNVDLIFHEAGHMIFIPFGRTMSILGGSLFQVLLPLILMFAFLIKNKDGFAASLCLWWAGQSMMDIAPYIADARALRLPLLGGGTGADSVGRHDWQNLLRQWGFLEYDIEIASVVDAAGSGVLLIALIWGAFMLFIYSHRLID